MKNKIFKFISLGLMTASLPVALISCSSTWTQWDPKKQNNVEINFENKIAKSPDQYEIRANLTNLYKVDGVEKNAIIYLHQINNQYELLSVIKEVLNFKLSFKIDEVWNDLEDDDASNDKRLLKFMENIKNVITLKFDTGDTNDDGTAKLFIVEWNIEDIVKKIKDVYDNFSSEQYPPLLRLDPNTNDIKDGKPTNFIEVAKVGKDFLAFSSIRALLSLDGTFALELSKLVNLPQAIFNQFSNFIKKIDELWDAIYNRAFDIYWVRGHEIKNDENITFIKGVDFSVQANGTIEKNYQNTKQNNLNKLKGSFIIKGLKP